MKLVPPANINTITSKHQHNFHSHIMKFFDARFTIPLSHQGSLLKLIAYQSCFLSELHLQSEDFEQRKAVLLSIKLYLLFLLLFDFRRVTSIILISWVILYFLFWSLYMWCRLWW